MNMTDGQRKVLVGAFALLRAGARTGAQLAREGTAPQVHAHLCEMEHAARRMREELEKHVGASIVLARAKTLSSSRRDVVPLARAGTREQDWAREMFQRGDFPRDLSFSGVLNQAVYDALTDEILLDVRGEVRRWRVPR